MFWEILVLAIIITSIAWLFGVEEEKIAKFYLGILALLFIGVLLGVGVQISYIIFPIAGG